MSHKFQLVADARMPRRRAAPQPDLLSRLGALAKLGTDDSRSRLGVPRALAQAGIKKAVQNLARRTTPTSREKREPPGKN